MLFIVCLTAVVAIMIRIIGWRNPAALPWLVLGIIVCILGMIAIVLMPAPAEAAQLEQGVPSLDTFIGWLLTLLVCVPAGIAWIVWLRIT